MRVLLTGASGNLGSETLPFLLDRGHTVRCFDLDSAHSRRVLERYRDRIECVWGDLTSESDVRRAVIGSEVVLHNAAIVPPFSELKPELSRRVNVEGTRHLIRALQDEAPRAKLLFASSIATFGITQPREVQKRRADSPLSATDHYSSHKIECEHMLRESGLTFCVLRIGASPPLNPQSGDKSLLKFMFERSLDSRVEYVHPRDVGRAQAAAVDCEAAWGKVLLIGGGKRCQITHRELINGLLEHIGIGALPERAFGSTYLYGDWLDTEESERLLQYQQHTYQDFLNEVTRNLGLKRFGVSLMAPLARRLLLRYSPYAK